MKALVCVKRVIDFNVRIQVKPDRSGVVTDGVKTSVNPFDEIALEESIRLKETGIITEVVAVTIGDAQCEQVLRSALAFGADRAVRVEVDQDVQPLGVARILAAVFMKEKASLVMMGKQAIDDDANQTGQMLAGLLDLPQATFASKVEILNSEALVTREIDTGTELIKVRLPAVITTDLRLNQPRYIKLPDVMKAKRKPIELLDVADLNVQLSPKLVPVKFSSPPVRSKGIFVSSVDELLSTLRGKGLVGS